MLDLHQHVARSIERHALLERGQAILVAVSGGSDSMVLLRLLQGLSKDHQWRLTVAHLNHQLRGRSSDADERLVRRTAAKLGLSSCVERVEVAAIARRKGLSLEMAAREVRHDFLARSAARAGISTIALAHHADDQLELFFLRLFRGSGAEGLAGMKWSGASPAHHGLRLVRPLLDLPKSVLCKYAAAAGIPFREDASNASLAIQRNRIRHELLPLLRRHYQPALDKTIQRAAEILASEADFVLGVARGWLEGVRSGGPGGARALKRVLWPTTAAGFGAVSTPFGKLPVAVQRRVLQLQLREWEVEAEYDLIEELRQNADTPVSTARRPGASGSPVVSRDVLGLVRLQEPGRLDFKSESIDLDLKGRTGQTRFGGRLIRWEIVLAGALTRSVQMVGQELFDADKVGVSIVLRHWRAGDRFQPIGMARPVKVQDLFTNLKISRSDRHQLLVAVTERSEIFWVEGLRIAEGFKLTAGTRRRLRWRWQRL